MKPPEKGIHDTLMKSEIPDDKLQSAWGAAGKHKGVNPFSLQVVTYRRFVMSSLSLIQMPKIPPADELSLPFLCVKQTLAAFASHPDTQELRYFG